MAKKKSRSGASSSNSQSDARRSLPDHSHEFALRVARQATARLLADRIRARARALQEVEDRRRYHPAKHRSAAAFNRPHHVLKAKPNRRGQGVPKRVRFEMPQKVAICVRRQRRKEVLHAKHIAGRGGLRRPRRNWFSDVSC